MNPEAASPGATDPVPGQLTSASLQPAADPHRPFVEQPRSAASKLLSWRIHAVACLSTRGENFNAKASNFNDGHRLAVDRLHAVRPVRDRDDGIEPGRNQDA